ncbi:MAG TPA: hypothetical protein H9819_05685 [Candidatus Bacteroides merdipullorum]|uniref:Uncharacterized protein n=1 Tax=Candidatus Bacteroides merdipullorum TaxID=2838474 RepID=A0A9D2CXB6_9BACE|nr:hypothetical protein [Candidatus Bacteroides merdipullorum]
MKKRIFAACQPLSCAGGLLRARTGRDRCGQEPRFCRTVGEGPGWHRKR